MLTTGSIDQRRGEGQGFDADTLAATLGARLIDLGLLDALSLRRAERAAQQSGKRFDRVLTELGLVPEDRLVAALAEALGLAWVEADAFPAAPLLADQVDPTFLRSKLIVPIADEPDRIVVAVADPFDVVSVQSLSFLFERPVERCLATAGDIERTLERLYGRQSRHEGASTAPAATASSPVPAIDEDARRLEDLASHAPTIRLVQDIITRAVEARASDIHIEPRTDRLRVRLRIDGVLHTVETLAREQAAGITSRIKVLAHLDIAERRLPQDGRIKSVVRGREIDMRISTMPTMAGESCVLRILDRAAVSLDYAALGFSRELLAGIDAQMRQPHGIVLVTGPTGSGKTTTLYTALGSLDAEAAKIFTVEDPIEYQLSAVNQIQVQPRIGLGFATALRSILRQDPDVIMVGEIRDLETAQIAIQASLTGHLVLSTVHTNSAAATVTRLIDMGLESYLLASSVTGILAQRLVRRLCGTCAEPFTPTPEVLARLAADIGVAALDPKRIRMRARVGCAACRNTGFEGRAAIGELLVVAPAVRDIIHARGSDRQIEAAAVAAGMTTLYRDGVGKALAGETTLEEVLRVTRLG
jgi:general secretion pathway protein E